MPQFHSSCFGGTRPLDDQVLLPLALTTGNEMVSN